MAINVQDHKHTTARVGRSVSAASNLLIGMLLQLQAIPHLTGIVGACNSCSIYSPATRTRVMHNWGEGLVRSSNVPSRTWAALTLVVDPKVAIEPWSWIRLWAMATKPHGPC